MKATQFTYAALAFSCLATLAACSGHETELDPKEKTPVAITASVSGEVVTKADNNYQPAYGDKKIYLYYKDGSNTATHEKGAYIFSEGVWTPEISGTGIFWDDLDAVGGSYPFFAVSPKDLANATTGAVEQDQSTDNNFTNSDLLMAYTPSTTKKENVSLTFKHMLAKLTVKVKVDAINNFTSSTVTIPNAIKGYTVNYTSPDPTAETPATVTVKSDGTPVELTPHTDAAENGNKTQVYSVILPPQDISSSAAKVKTTITVGSTSNTYTYAPTLPTSPVSLTNGTHTTLTLTVKGTGIVLENILVTDWTTATADGDITIDSTP